MRLPLTITTAALAITLAAGTAQAAAATPTEQQKATNGVVVLIGANDYGLLAPSARTFTSPIGTDKGSVTSASPSGIIAILIG
jgi:hypothetical protein